MKEAPIILFCLLFVVGGWACRAPAPSEDQPFSLPSPLQERADEFYRILCSKRLNSLSTLRNREISAFFTDEESFRTFITDLSYHLREARFKDNLFTDFRIIEMSSPLERGKVRLGVEFTGDYPDLIVFWENTLVLGQEWVMIQGQWYPFPPRY